MLARAAAIRPMPSIFRAIPLASIPTRNNRSNVFIPNAASSTGSAAATAPIVKVSGSAMGPHSLMFKIERYFAVGMLPLLPAAYFIHTPTMDLLLSAAIVMHTHWGMMAVIQDYARPIVIGERLAKIAPALVYITSVILLAGLFHFNTNDVGLTKAFEMFFSL